MRRRQSLSSSTHPWFLFTCCEAASQQRQFRIRWQCKINSKFNSCSRCGTLTVGQPAGHRAKNRRKKNHDSPSVCLTDSLPYCLTLFICMCLEMPILYHAIEVPHHFPKLQRTSVTVTLVGIGKSVTITDCRSNLWFSVKEGSFLGPKNCPCNRCHCNRRSLYILESCYALLNNIFVALFKFRKDCAADTTIDSFRSPASPVRRTDGGRERGRDARLFSEPL